MPVPPKAPSLTFADLGLRQITFTWSPVVPECPVIHYNILALNCGSCPTTTNHTTVTCTDVPTDGSVCTFSTKSVVCGSIIGNVSDNAQGIFKSKFKLWLMN